MHTNLIGSSKSNFCFFFLIHNLIFTLLLLFIYPTTSSADQSSGSQVASAVSLSTGSTGAAGAPAASGSAAASGSGTVLPDLFTGSLTYSVPITVPQGRNGMEPGLALVYRSNRGNGWIGVGWDIEIGSVSRSIKNGVNYQGDEFVLEMSGSAIDLIKKDGTYHARIESAFLRIRRLPGNDGEYWEVTDKTGRRYLFGQRPDSRQFDPNNTSNIFKWCLDRVEDTNGNYMVFTYDKDEGQIYLKQIDYSYHINNQVAALNRVIFHLAPRQDAPVMYTTNFAVKTALRLKTIEITAGGFPIRAYKLEYDTDPIMEGAQYSASTQRTILTMVQQYGKDYTIINGTVTGGSYLPPVFLKNSENGKFTTQDWSTSPYLAIESKLTGIDLDKTASNSCGQVISSSTVLTGDFNGDGKTDIAHSVTGCGKWNVSLSNKTGGFVTTEWSTSPFLAIENNTDGHEVILTGDFNGDGKTDIAHSRSQWGYWRISLANNEGNGFITQEWLTNQYYSIDWLQDGYEQVIPGDFNGDGKTDIAHARKGWNFWRVAITNNEGNGFIIEDWPTSPYLAIESKISGGIQLEKIIPSCGSTASYSTILSGDFNGDGKTDIAHSRTGCDKWFISLSNKTGNGFVTQEWMTSPYYAVDNNTDGHEMLLTGDFNGDGKTDIAHSRTNWSSWRLALSTGSGFVNQDWSTSPHYTIENLVSGYERILTGDFNGDGKTDIAHTFYAWGMWRVSLSTGYGLITDDWPTNPYLAVDNLIDGYESVIVGDFSGDGKTDVAHARKGWDSWKVSFDDMAVIPDLLTEIKNSTGGVMNMDYASSTDYENNVLPFSVQTLSSVSADDGKGTVTITRYAYKGGHFDISEKEFRGFRYAKVNGPVGPSGEQSISETWFLQGNNLGVDFENLGTISTNDILPQDISNNPNIEIGFMKGKVYFTQVTNGFGHVYSKSLMLYAGDVDNVEPYFNPLKEIRSFTCDGDACTVQTRMRLLYDQYGNATREYVYGDVVSNIDDKTVDRNYGYNIGAWIVGLPKTETVYKGIGTTAPVSATTFYYDGVTDCLTPSTNQVPTVGNLTRTLKWLTGAMSPEIRVAYDEYGNLKCTRDANGNLITIQYESTFTFPVNKKNAKDHQVITKFYGVAGENVDKGLYGQVKNVTDANDITLSNEYDIFGRLIRTIDPYTTDAQLGNKSLYYEHTGNVELQKIVNYSTDMNASMSSNVICPAGSDYRLDFNLCVTGSVCNSGIYDVNSNLCTLPATCPVGTTLNTSRNICESAQVCTPGVYKSCFSYIIGAMTCPSSTIFNYNAGRCEGAARCSAGTYNTTLKACTLETNCTASQIIAGDLCAIQSSCPEGTILNTTSDMCESEESYIWTEAFYDGFGRTYMTRSEGPDGKVIVSEKEFNSNGKVKRSSLPYFEGIEEPRWINYTYDPMGRVISIVNPDNTSSTACYNDGTTIMINADHHRKDEVRDVFGRLITVREYLGEHTSCSDAGQLYATTHYEYDVMGNLERVTDAENNETIMQYDTLGRKKYMKDPDMGEWSYTYYPNGNLYTQTDAKGKTITFYYDELNRVTKKNYADGIDVMYTYDIAPDTSAETYPIGRLSMMTDESGTTKYFYDKLGRATKTASIIDGVSYDISTTYDTLGRITSIKYPNPAGSDGEVVQYLYDSAGNLSQVVGYAAFSEYDALGRAKYTTYGNNIVTTYEYDPVNSRLSRIMTKNPSNPDPAQQTLLELGYGYYTGGNVRNIFNYRNTDRSQFFIYDELNRLTWAEIAPNSQPLIYNYDQIGNILLKEGLTYKYADDLGLPGPVHAVRETSDGKQYSYDENGNMIGDTVRVIDYNYDNMPKTISMNSLTSEFKYSGSGARVKKIAPAGTTTYIGKLYECSNNGVCSKYIFAGGTRIALKTPSESYYYHQDHLGSSIVVTDTTGAVREDIAYYPFGATRIDAGDISVNHKYTSQEFDTETGLYYYNARYYNPVLGRFISADALVPDFADPQTLNRYSYVNNNPLLYIDPSGDFLIEAIVAGAIIGAISTGAQTDWQFRYMLSGAMIGAAAGATGFEAGTFAFTQAGGQGFGAMFAGGVVGGAAGGATAGGMSAMIYGGNITDTMLNGATSGAFSGAVTAGLMRIGIPGSIAAAGGGYVSGFTECGSHCGSEGALYAFSGQTLNNTFVMSNLFKTRQPVPAELRPGEHGPNRLTFMRGQNPNTTYVTTPALSLKGLDSLWFMVGLLGNGYSHTWHVGDAYVPTGHYFSEVQSGVPYPTIGETYNSKANFNLITNNCTTRFGYSSPGRYYSNFNYAGQGSYWWDH